tara:strand:- start:199 stop:498 length:300 start_codon:yes stop_codon:yes gene_type:complete
MNIKPSALHEIYADLLRDRMEWAEGAIDKLGKEADNDVTGSVKGMLKHWTSIRAAFRWEEKHNTVRMWEGILKKYEISSDGHIIQSAYDTAIRVLNEQE